MGERVSYELDGSIATITMDDGKVNALSHEMFGELNEAFDRAENDDAIVVLTGRDGIFSAGFHLETLTGGGDTALDLLLTGFELSYRLLSYPKPVVVACTGHAMAMGLFLMLSGDERIGVAGGDHKIVANEVAIGMTLPWTPIEICRIRLDPAHLQRALNLSATYTPDAAVDAGLLDRVVPEGELVDTARSVAESMGDLNLAAHGATKLRTREEALQRVRAAIERDESELRGVL